MKYAYIWSDLLDRGVVVATGTDYSVSPDNPFYTLHAAITRQDRNNNPPGGWEDRVVCFHFVIDSFYAA